MTAYTLVGGPCAGRMSDTADVPVKDDRRLLAIPKTTPLVQAKGRPERNVQVIQAVCRQCSMVHADVRGMR